MTLLFWIVWVAFSIVYSKASNRWPVLDLIAAAAMGAAAVAAVLTGRWLLSALYAACLAGWLFYARRDYARRARTTRSEP